ncbi:MAG TPA: mucoidy inhibitor MuiA family protein [Hanamia sp.]
MRNAILFAALLLINTTAKGQAKKIAAETSIQNVTIFSSGARVERLSSVAIPAGRSEISFSGLSNQLDQQSVQLKADADITLFSVQTTKDFMSARKIDEEEKSFIDKNNTLQDKLDLDNKLLEVYKNEETMLIKNEAIGGTTGVKTAELKDALDLHRQRLTEVYQKELGIQKRINSEKNDLEISKAQLQQFSKKRDSISYIVTALIDSKATKNVNFNLLYNVKDAGWYPTYDVKVKDVTAPLEVLMNANVFQRSGETWKNVSLILSTGNPNENATPSQLQPWMLGFYDPSVSFRNDGNYSTATGRVTDENGEPIAGATVMIENGTAGTSTDKNGFFKLQNVSGSGTLVVTAVGFESKQLVANLGYFNVKLKTATMALNEVVVVGYGTARRSDITDETEVQGLKEEKKSIKTVAVATQYQPTATVYKIDDKYTLETDGKTTTIGIKQFDVNASYDYLAAPKIDPSAFLTAKIINWQDYDLQSGEASLYFEGTYLGKTYIDLDATGDTLSLSLGKDNGIKVSRKLIKEFSSKRFIGSNKTETKQYEITLKNTKKDAVNITVNDQFPISTVKEINVDDEKAPEAQIDKETGIATWTLSLKPGEERKLDISFGVKYPKDKSVVLE